MAWPRSAIWGRRTNAVRAEIDRVARTICAYEPVRLLYDPDDCGALPPVAEIEQVAGHYDDIWLRATGRILTRDEAIVCRFNGWGGRGWEWRRDVEAGRSEAHTSELQSLMRNSYAVFRLQKNKKRI